MQRHRFFQYWPTSNVTKEYEINIEDHNEALAYFIEEAQEDTFAVREIGDGRLEFMSCQLEGLMIRRVTPNQGIILFYNLLCDRERAQDDEYLQEPETSTH